MNATAVDTRERHRPRPANPDADADSGGCGKLRGVTTTPNGGRLQPTDPEAWDDGTRAALDGLRSVNPEVGELNIFTTLAHHPKLLKRWLVFANHILTKSTLPARQRELVILRTGWRCESEYEFGQHTLIGRRAGLTDAEIRALAGDGSVAWDPPDAALVAATDELVATHDLTDATWAVLDAHFSTEQVLDTIFTVGQYAMVSTFLRAARVAREPGVPGWPGRGPSAGTSR